MCECILAWVVHASEEEDGEEEKDDEAAESEEDEDAVRIIERPAKVEKPAEAVGWKALKRKMDEVDAAEAEPKKVGVTLCDIQVKVIRVPRATSWCKKHVEQKSIFRFQTPNHETVTLIESQDNSQGMSKQLGDTRQESCNERGSHWHAGEVQTRVKH